MPPTTYMLLTLPTEAASDDVWDTLLNTALEAVDAHDHTTGKGTKVPTAGININAALEFNSNRATELAGVAFAALGADLSTGSYELYVDPAGALKFRNGTGTNVRITSGGALDMTTVGGIAGDYTSVGAEVAFVDAQDGYTFKQQTGGGARQYAKMDCADLRLYEYIAHPTGGAPTNFAGLKSPAGLAGSYTLTMPTALPGSQLLLQLTAAGVLTPSNTVPNAVTMSSTLGVTGLITATAGVTAAANQHVTVSGTGRHKHATQYRPVSFAGMIGLSGGVPAGWSYNSAGGYIVSTGTAELIIQIPCVEGEVIESFTYEYYGDGVADILTAQVFKRAAGAAAAALISDAGGGVTNPAVAWVTSADLFSVNYTVAAGDSIFAVITVNATNIRIANARVGYSF